MFRWRSLSPWRIAAFFDGVGKNQQDREALRQDYAGMVQLQPERMVDVSARLRERVMPFNWEIEFPEVFDRENGGFDAIVGNPPFAGKNTTTSGNTEGYPDWLKDIYAESHGNSDLVAFFFRRSFDLLRTGGTMGLIATNTIAQGVCTILAQNLQSATDPTVITQVASYSFLELGCGGVGVWGCGILD
jgi:hypothetical protein